MENQWIRVESCQSLASQLDKGFLIAEEVLRLVLCEDGKRDSSIEPVEKQIQLIGSNQATPLLLYVFDWV